MDPGRGTQASRKALEDGGRGQSMDNRGGAESLTRAQWARHTVIQRPSTVPGTYEGPPPNVAKGKRYYSLWAK